jgi:hypothetical protein
MLHINSGVPRVLQTVASRLLTCSWWLFYLSLLFLYFLSLPSYLQPTLRPPPLKSVHEALQRITFTNVLVVRVLSPFINGYMNFLDREYLIYYRGPVFLAVL